MDEFEFVRQRPTISLPKLREAAQAVEQGTGYHRARIPKRRGGYREICIPESAVDIALTGLRDALSDLSSPLECVHGYVRGRGIFSNALPHCGQPVVLNLDLREFFPSIGRSKVEPVLSRLGMNEGLRSLIISATLVDDQLPAGFPTSPVISNLVFEETDESIAEWASSHGLAYSRYADDLTFSGVEISHSDVEVLGSILGQADWALNPTKTRMMRSGSAQYVTGLYVGLKDGPRVPRRVKRRLRMQIYYLERFGYSNCHDLVPWTPGYHRVHGWLHYIRQIEPVTAARIDGLIRQIDFDRPSRLRGDLDWDAMLDELGIPEW